MLLERMVMLLERMAVLLWNMTMLLERMAMLLERMAMLQRSMTMLLGRMAVLLVRMVACLLGSAPRSKRQCIAGEHKIRPYAAMLGIVPLITIVLSPLNAAIPNPQLPTPARSAR
jgi:hypothetical protein